MMGGGRVGTVEGCFQKVGLGSLHRERGVWAAAVGKREVIVLKWILEPGKQGTWA